MDRLINNLKSKSVKLTIAIFALLLILAVTIDVTIRDQGGYLILFSLIYVLLPGFLFVAAIDKDFIKRFRVQGVIIAFFCGFALLIGQYYLLNALGLLFLIKFTPLACIILLTFLSVKNLKQLKPDINITKLLDQALPYLFLIAITMVASYVALKSSVPDENTAIHIDYTYHMGNVNILSRGGNLEDTRVMGMTFKYHYFMDLFYAVLQLVFPAKTWNCVLRYPILLIAPLVAPSIYSFAKSAVKKPFFCFLLSVIILLFPSICPRITSFSALIISNFNNVGFAVPMVISVAQLFIFSAQKEKYKYSDLVLIFLLILVLTGTKGPFALILTGTMFIFMLFCLLSKREITVFQVLVFLSALISFLIIWFSLLNVAINDQNVHSQNQGLLKYLDYLVILDRDSVLQNHSSDPRYALLTVPLSLIECFGSSAIPFLLFIPVMIIRLFRRNIDKHDYTALFNIICVCVSVGGSYLLALNSNRLYFLMMATPFIYMSAAEFFAFAFNHKNRILKILLSGISTILLCLTVYCSIQSPVKFVAWFGKPQQGEIDGIAWIRENTDENALFAINDHAPGEKGYYYSAYTERRFYLESYSYASNSGKTMTDLESQAQINEKLFTGTDSSEIAAELGIDYFIYYDISGQTPEVLEENYSLCYSSDCLKIYRRA